MINFLFQLLQNIDILVANKLGVLAKYAWMNAFWILAPQIHTVYLFIFGRKFKLDNVL